MNKLYIISILALISFFNASYLTYSAIEYKSGNIEKFACDINSTLSCSTLFSFDFSWFGPVPFPAIAMLVYPIILILAIMGIKNKLSNVYKIIFFMAIGGLVFNSYIIYNEYLVKVFCPACLGCTFAIFIIGILSLIGLKEKK